MKYSRLIIISLIALLFSCEKNKTPLSLAETPNYTSHDFTWRIDTLGEGPSFSSLWDVAIINENSIWVVGEIFMQDTYQLDSLGNIIHPYNAAHWNGEIWELHRIFYFNYGQQWLIRPIMGILPISENEFWLASGSIWYWNGGLASLSYLRDINTSEVVTKLWGNSQVVYGIGNAGIVVTYDGTGWQKIDSHIDIALTDVWGETDLSGKTLLYATASTGNNDQDSKVLKIENNIVTEVSSEGLPYDISGIWFAQNVGYYVVGDGIFYTPELNETSQWVELVPEITGYYTHAIAANGGNDIFIVGSFGTAIHYSGNTWKNYSNNEVPFFFGRFKRVEMKGELMVAVGYASIGPTRGIILMGKRVNQ